MTHTGRLVLQQCLQKSCPAPSRYMYKITIFSYLLVTPGMAEEVTTLEHVTVTVRFFILHFFKISSLFTVAPVVTKHVLGGNMNIPHKALRKHY